MVRGKTYLGDGGLIAKNQLSSTDVVKFSSTPTFQCKFKKNLKFKLST